MALHFLPWSLRLLASFRVLHSTWIPRRPWYCLPPRTPLCRSRFVLLSHIPKVVLIVMRRTVRAKVEERKDVEPHGLRWMPLLKGEKIKRKKR